MIVYVSKYHTDLSITSLEYKPQKIKEMLPNFKEKPTEEKTKNKYNTRVILKWLRYLDKYLLIMSEQVVFPLHCFCFKCVRAEVGLFWLPFWVPLELISLCRGRAKSTLTSAFSLVSYSVPKAVMLFWHHSRLLWGHCDDNCDTRTEPIFQFSNVPV